jgi:hypothetical protein
MPGLSGLVLTVLAAVLSESESDDSDSDKTACATLFPPPDLFGIFFPFLPLFGGII